MITTALIITILLGSLCLYAAGAIVSLLLLSKRAKSLRNIGAHAPAFLGSVGLVLASVLFFVQGTPITFTLPSTFDFIPFLFRLDLLSAFFLLLIGVLGAVASCYAGDYLKHYEEEYNLAFLGFAYNIFLASMALVVTANNALYFLVVWEIMSLSSYLLIVFEHHREDNVRAGLFYFIMMHIGGAAITGALLLLAHAYGTTNFDVFRAGGVDLGKILPSIVFILALIGFGTKAGMMPFHTWLPEAHPAAPSHVSALMSGVMVKTALYMLIRVIFDFMPLQVPWWGVLLMCIGALGAVLGILTGLAQTNIKKLLAYSTIENIGLITLMLGAAVLFSAYHAPTLAIVALVAMLFHIGNHAFFKGLLFLSAGSVVSATGTTNIEAYGGLAKRMPKTTIAFFVAALAACAFPPLNGFASEWLMFQILFTGVGAPILSIKLLFLGAIVAIALTSGLTMLTFVKAFGGTFLARPRSEGSATAHEAGFGSMTAYAILAFLVIWIGLVAKSLLPLLSKIASSIESGALAANTVQKLPMLNMTTIALVMFIAVIVALLITASFALRTKVVIGRTWDCGYPLAANNEISATAFSRSILMILKKILPTKKHAVTEGAQNGNTYFMSSKTVTLEVVNVFEKYLYQPIERVAAFLNVQVKKIQNGHVNLYILYILVTLILLILFSL